MRPVIGMTCKTTDWWTGSGNGLGMDYISAIENAGGIPILLPLIQDDSRIADSLNLIDGLLLPGGPDVDSLLYHEEPQPVMGQIDVDKDRVEMQLIPGAFELDLPILGICRGIQILNVAAGGTLYQDVSMGSSSVMKHRQEAPGSYATHAINVKEGSRLLDIMGKSEIRVNSFHHQAVKKPAQGFAVSAVASDGIIEAIESLDHSFVIGVQFHAELMWRDHPSVNNLFTEFVRAAGTHKQKQKVE